MLDKQRKKLLYQKERMENKSMRVKLCCFVKLKGMVVKSLQSCTLHTTSIQIVTRRVFSSLFSSYYIYPSIQIETQTCFLLK